MQSHYMTPYAYAVALVARVTGVGAIGALELAGVVNCILILVGMRSLVSRLTASERNSTSIIAIVLGASLWGTVVAPWSGIYGLASFLLVLPYPSTFAAAMMIFFLAMFDRWLCGETRRTWPLSLFVLIIVLISPFTAVNTVVGAVAFIVARRPSWRQAGRLGVAIGVAAFLTALWPFYSLLDLLPAAGSFADSTSALLDTVHGMSFLALVGLPALWYRFRKTARDPLCVLFAISTILLAVGYITGSASLARVLPMAMAPAHLSLGQEIATRDRAIPRLWLVVTFVAISVGLTAQVGHLATSPRWPDYSWIADHVQQSDVVAAEDVRARMSIPAFGGRIVTPHGPDPYIADASQRTSDEVLLFDPTASGATKLRILDRYEVRWLLARKESVGGLPVTAVLTGPSGETLFQVVRE